MKKLCQVSGKHTVGGIVFYKHLFLVYLKIGKFYTFFQLGKGPIMGPKISLGKSLKQSLLTLPGCNWPIIEFTGPDSVMVRAFALGAGGHGFDPGSHRTKDVKNVTSGYLTWRSVYIRQALASLLSKR